MVYLPGFFSIKRISDPSYQRPLGIDLKIALSDMLGLDSGKKIKMAFDPTPKKLGTQYPLADHISRV